MGNKNKFMVFMFLCCAGIMTISFITSCGKNNNGNVSPATSHIQFQVVNLSPDLHPVNLYIGSYQQGNNSYSYPSPSGYFSITNTSPPIQIRSAVSTESAVNILSIDTLIMHPYFKYSLFITGLKSENTVTSFLTIDTAAPPTAGRGKIRFVNASPHSTSFDVSANDIIAFKDQKYKNVSRYISMPPGNYNFKVMPAGQSTVISTFPNVNIADGKVYTLYCRGVAGGADSVAFGTGIITNR